MLYKNKRTGVVIDVQSECGGEWELVEDVKKEEPEEPKKAKRKKDK